MRSHTKWESSASAGIAMLRQSHDFIVIGAADALSVEVVAIVLRSFEYQYHKLLLLKGILGASPCQQISKAFVALRGSQDL